MKTTHFISDGYDEPGYIAEQPGLFPAMRFTYRPMLAVERDAIAAQSVRRSPKEYHDHFLVPTLADFIKSWDAVDKVGQSKPISAASVRTLRPRLFDRLYSIVCGDSPSDIDPLSTPDEQNEAADMDLLATITGRSIGQAKQEADAKNS